jgi:hypothetical protein
MLNIQIVVIIRWMLMDLEEIVILFHIKVAGAT